MLICWLCVCPAVCSVRAKSHQGFFFKFQPGLVFSRLHGYYIWQHQYIAPLSEQYKSQCCTIAIGA